MTKKPSSSKKGGAGAKAPKAGKGAKAGAKPGEPGHNSEKMSDADRQQLFLRHRDAFERIEGEYTALDKKFDAVVAAAKNDGFSKKMLEVALKMDDPDKDSKLRHEVRELMTVAVWLGDPIKFKQGDLFAGTKDAPAADQARPHAVAEGRAASAANKPRKVPPKYAPSDAAGAYNSWLEGYDTHQKELAGGVGRGGAGKPTDPPQSGVPVTRSEYEKNKGAPAQSSSAKLAEQQGIDGEGDDGTKH